MRKDPCKIAYVIDDLALGGAQKQLTIIAPLLPGEFKPQIYCLSERMHPFGDVALRAGIPVFTFKRRSHLDFLRLVNLTRALAREKVDIIHGFLTAANAYAFLSSRFLSKPAILSLQSNRPRLGRMKTKVIFHMLRQTEKVMVNSRAGATFLSETVGIRRENIALVRNWFQRPNERGPRYDPGKKGETVGYVGRFSKEKRVDILISAFELVGERFPSSRLVLVGGGPEEEKLSAQVKELHLGDRVRFTGPALDVLCIMEGFRCLVLPSAFEGLPNVLVEALALGVPVVATPVGDVAELIVPGKTGVLVEERDPESLARAIVEALRSDSLSENAAIYGPRTVEENFSIEAAVDGLTSLYRNLI